MTPAEILERAADEMQRRGKCEGDFSDLSGRVCALGAIAVAWGIPLNEIGPEPFSGSCLAASQALDAFVPSPPDDCWLSPIASWSDRSDAPTVIAGLRAVAATLRAQAETTPATTAERVIA